MALIARKIRPLVVSALADARVVCLLGARQTGKTTLVKSLARDEHAARYVTLDDPAALEAAREDPMGFVAGSDRLVIDEVQRAPGLLLAIKRVVDSDSTRGRFLLTGSANILTMPQIADTLPGRVDYLTLWPFGQDELEGSSADFLGMLFAGGAPVVSGAPVGRESYAERVVRGGFPEAAPADDARRRRFFAGYADSILGREVGEIGAVRDSGSAGRVLRLIAARSSMLANMSSIGRDLGIDHKTAANYLRALEQLFMVVRLPPWHANLGHRVVKSAKLHIADTGMLCALLGVDANRLSGDGSVAGAAFETFVVNEAIRQVSASEIGPLLSFHHYRDQRGHEVDLVIEHADGGIVGIEVKASATPRAGDAAGLRFMRDRLGDRFRHGVVLHLGPETIPIGDRLSAVPLAGLWSLDGSRETA